MEQTFPFEKSVCETCFYILLYVFIYTTCRIRSHIDSTLWATIHAVSFFNRVLQYCTFLENCNVYYKSPSKRLAKDYSITLCV